MLNGVRSAFGVPKLGQIGPNRAKSGQIGGLQGFLGMLHMEVFGQRLEQEHAMDTIMTAPSARQLRHHFGPFLTCHRLLRLCVTLHAPCDVLYLAPMLAE